MDRAEANTTGRVAGFSACERAIAHAPSCDATLEWQDATPKRHHRLQERAERAESEAAAAREAATAAAADAAAARQQLTGAAEREQRLNAAFQEINRQARRGPRSAARAATLAGPSLLARVQYECVQYVYNIHACTISRQTARLSSSSSSECIT
jgi:uncharacterized membrane protein YqiK